MGLQFEWDEEKEKINIVKHGIDFKTTVEEDRYITIGFVEEILTVVYTERTTALRIISARVATKKERMVYYGD